MTKGKRLTDAQRDTIKVKRTTDAQGDTITITVKRFTFTKAQWKAIKAVVRDALGHDADRIVLDSVRMDGTKHAVTLRKQLAATTRLHIMRDLAMRSLPTQLAFLKDVTGKREDAVRLRDWIGEVFWLSHNGYAPDKDMLAATDAYFEKLLKNLDGIIHALGPPRKKMGSASSTKKSRNQFWSDLRAIWCQIGGKLPDGVDAADFLIAVSRPVLGVVERGTVIQWLWRNRQR